MFRLEAIVVDDWPGIDAGVLALAENWTGGPAYCDQERSEI